MNPSDSLDIYSSLHKDSSGVMHTFSKNLFRQKDIKLDEKTYDQFFEKYKDDIFEAISKIIALRHTEEHMQTLGHDHIHITYDLLEFLYLVQNVELKQSEKYSILFASLLHDLGRYPELLSETRSGAMDLEKKKEIQLHAALGGYLSVILAKSFKNDKEDNPSIIEASLALNRRVIAAVLFHGGRNETRDIVAHHVQSIDRLAGILGVREFVRNLITDGVQRGAKVYPDEKLSYDKTFPLFNNLPTKDFENAEDPKGSWTNIVHYLEMPMRNIFALSSDFATQRSDNMRRESGMILTLLSGGPGTKLYNQIFAPELNAGDEYSFPKTKLPDHIWESIKLGLTEEEGKTMKMYQSLDLTKLTDIMLQQQAPHIQKDERKKLDELIGSVPESHLQHIKEAIIYVIARCELNKEQEKEFLQTCASSDERVISFLANQLLSSDLFSVHTNTKVE